jgi:HK97 family phage portal protein
MAIWRFPFVSAKKFNALNSKVEKLRQRAIGGVNVPGELLSALFGDSETSIKIDEENALTLSAVYAALNISVDSLNIPVEVFIRQADGGRMPVSKDRPFEYQVRRLLHTSPSLLHTPSQWFQLMESSRLIYGNGYSLIYRNGLDEPIALRWLHPLNVDVKLINNRELRYWIRNDQGGYELENVPSKDMIHVKGFSTDGVMGRGVIDLAKESLAGGMAAQKTGNKFYKDGMTSKVVLSHPGQLDADGAKNLKGSFDDSMKAGGTVLLEEGVKVFTLTIPPEQAQFLQSRVFSVTEVARWFNVPEHMLSNNQHSTFSNIENQFLQYVINNVRPRIRAWEQELNWKLLTNYDDAFVKFNLNALMRADTQSRAAYYTQAIQNGWMNRNEVRGLENLNNVEGGDEFLTPMNLATDRERLSRLDYGEEE